MVLDSLLLGALGCAVGILASLVGLGGGVFIVPLLLLGGFVSTSQTASGTSIVAVLATSLSAAFAYLRVSAVALRIGLLLMPAAVVSAWGGARITEGIPSRYLSLVFGLFLLYPAFRMLASRNRRPVCEGEVSRDLPLLAPRSLLGIAGVCAAGFLSGLLGIGGGALLVPLMAFVYGFPLITCIGTSLLIMVPSSAIACIQHAALDHVKWSMALPLAVGAAIGSQIGPRLAVRIPSRYLRMAFSAILVFVGVQMIVRAP